MRRTAERWILDAAILSVLLVALWGYSGIVTACYQVAAGLPKSDEEDAADAVTAARVLHAMARVNLAPEWLGSVIAGAVWLPELAPGVNVQSKEQAGALSDAARLTATRACVSTTGGYLLAVSTTIATIVLVWYMLKQAVGMLRQASRLDLEMGTFHDGSGPAGSGSDISELVKRNYLSYPRPEYRPSSVHLVVGPKLDFGIPAEVFSEDEKLGLLAAVINWLIPVQGYLLSGALHAPSDAGAGLTLTLMSKSTRSIIDTVTLWESTYNPPLNNTDPSDRQRYRLLAGPAAIWVHYSIMYAKMRRSRRQDTTYTPDMSMKQYLGPFWLFGTRKWEACALNFAATDYRARRFHADPKRDTERLRIAAQLIESALEKDPRYADAHFNLGTLQIELTAGGQMPPGDHYDRAQKSLERAICYTEWEKFDGCEAKSRYQTERTWYRAKYQLAAIDLYRLLEADDQRRACPQPNHADALMSAIERALQESNRRSWFERFTGRRSDSASQTSASEEETGRQVATGSLQEFLIDLWPSARALQASICLRQANRPIADIAPDEKQTRTMRRDSSRVLPAVPEFVEHHSKPDADVSRRTSYSLAGYFSVRAGLETVTDRREQSLEQSLDQLDQALTLGYDIVTWAKCDPSFGPVRQFKQTEFARLIDRHGPLIARKEPSVLSPVRLLARFRRYGIHRQGAQSKTVLAASERPHTAGGG